MKFSITSTPTGKHEVKGMKAKEPVSGEGIQIWAYIGGHELSKKKDQGKWGTCSHTYTNLVISQVGTTSYVMESSSQDTYWLG